MTKIREHVFDTTPTVVCELHMAGDYNHARYVVNKFVQHKSGCFSIWRADYIYTGGEERGFVVRGINYPRFGKTYDWSIVSLKDDLYLLGCNLCEALNQRSFTIITPDKTWWYSSRPEDIESRERER